MVDVTPLVRKDQNIIQSYKSGQFHVSGQVYKGAIIVKPDDICAWDCAGPDIHTLGLSDFAPVMEAAEQTDILLLGTGSVTDFPAPDVEKSLSSQGINIEMMSTDAACRTYNVLMAEGRRVAAALLPYIYRSRP
jgi:Uncharacterized conserved protein